MSNDPDRSRPANPSVDTNKRQDNSLWLQMWRDDRTEDFHQTAVNPLLIQYWHSQKLKRSSRILVPLCGKSLDMLWLAEQGHTVVGIELSPIAVKAFFNENCLKAKKTRNGNFTCWQSGTIIIWCGDFFSLRKHQLGHIDSVFDRAALTALPETIRRQYITQLRALIEVETGIFLLTDEHIAQDSQQPATQIDSEIVTLYAEHFDITLTHTQRLDPAQGSSSEEGFYIENKAYQLSQRLEDTGLFT
ncbi:thiopurine S-methyltransferase [Candidatus Thiothrix sp. Deng01]|uniref:Thiopurine S-methyltransferase n=1 Tax=Candidatus Thiothrix phosphatis TaxID=3112415 RepID=A0ABU6CVH5_9GAMM|nr:thiopurine S-methyltransferase [Candidatus Thiothrix sp. Deng01]MEB4590795.1 thiopurine S-methyltransferase [Candidatus Thiothrix sp. Deng01]